MTSRGPFDFGAKGPALSGDALRWNENDVSQFGGSDMNRRAPVQGDRGYWSGYAPEAKAGKDPKPPGTISWDEHLEAWENYAKQYGRRQSAERIAERKGFTYLELESLLGHSPRTWSPNE